MKIRPIKQFGQHFLTDSFIADAIVEAAEILPGEIVWEIGPGKGVLTERILAKNANLTAFEIDKRLAEYLAANFGNKLNLINRDILAIHWEKLLQEALGTSQATAKIVSNLPYQITSPVLYAIEENEQWFSRVVIMIQKEVADRLTAKAGTKAYGVLTLKLRYAFDIKALFNVPPAAFNPEPMVHSTVVCLTPRQNRPAPKSLDTYRKLIHAAFVQRRKTLRNNLKRLFEQQQLIELERNSGIEFNRRGETIEESEFVHLADCASELSRL